MNEKDKITSGANDRPKNETIAQSGPDPSDDSGRLPETSDEQVEKTRKKLFGDGGREQGGQPPNPDQVPEETPLSGENICRRCAGSGKLEDGACPDCGGTGIVTTPVGGGG